MPALRLTIPIALLACLALPLAGCGSSSEGTGTTPTSEPPASTSTAPGQEAPAGASTTTCAGGTSSGEIYVTGISCKLGRELVAGWYKDSACPPAKGASRTSCKLGKFTCLGAVTDRGVAVSCARPGRSVAFTGRPS
jgi:hypothetical protein